jgi:penicillin-binding protein 1C
VSLRATSRIVVRVAVAAAALAATVTLALAVAVVGWRYPLQRLATPPTSLTVVDRRGVVLRQSATSAGGRAAWAPLGDLPPLFVDAVLAGEDRDFYAHRGVDFGALGRAALRDVRARRLAYGGSTLTMQLTRLVEPHPHTLAAKVGEVVRALRLERVADKRQILEQYVNRAYFGAGAWGVEAAAQAYFGKPAAALSDGEAALLATLPRRPEGYDLRRHLPEAIARRHHLFERLRQSGHLSAEAMARAEATAIALRRAEDSPAHPFLAPHFVDWVLASLSDDARRAGGVVQTTLDAPLQAAVERAVREHLAAHAGDGVGDAGVVVLDARTGAIRALVGSPDYFARDGGQVNIAARPRHPGSALKPFTYALALEDGATPASIAWDVARPESHYKARDPERHQHGPVRYRAALASSYNYAAVDVAERVGLGRLFGRLEDAGLSTLGPRAALTPRLTLGAGPVRLVDLAAAYAFLVDGGEVPRPFGWERVTPPGDAAARLAPPPSRRPLFSPAVSWLVMDMLADPAARRPAFGDDLPLDLPFRAAAKTGTSGGFADNWTVIATQEYVVAAWAGNFDGRPMHQMLAMWGAAPLARAALLAAADGRALTLPPAPPQIVTRPVCRLSGRVPGPHCPIAHERFVAGTEPRAPCDWHRVIDGEVRVVWPPEVAKWAAARKYDSDFSH